MKNELKLLAVSLLGILGACQGVYCNDGAYVEDPYNCNYANHGGLGWYSLGDKVETKKIYITSKNNSCDCKVDAPVVKPTRFKKTYISSRRFTPTPRPTPTCRCATPTPIPWRTPTPVYMPTPLATVQPLPATAFGGTWALTIKNQTGSCPVTFTSGINQIQISERDNNLSANILGYGYFRGNSAGNIARFSGVYPSVCSTRYAISLSKMSVNEADVSGSVTVQCASGFSCSSTAIGTAIRAQNLK